MSAEEPTLRERVREFLRGDGSNASRYFLGVIQVLIVLSIVGFTFETLPDLSAGQLRLLRQFEVLVIAIFTVEYLLLLWSSEKRLRFFFSFNGLIDLAVILPFYLKLGLDLRGLRIFWLFRLFRLFKLVRYFDAAKRIGDAFRMVRVDLAVFGIGAFFVFYLAAVGIYFFERDAQPETFASIIHSFWWALATLTTVGYGDVYPVTAGGKVFTFFTLMIGLGVFAVPTGLITMAIVNTRESNLGAEDELEDGADR
ncbi:MAG: ion transporter [Congregibacter sp.]